MSRLTLLVSTAVLLAMGSVAPAFGATIVPGPLLSGGCTSADAPLVTDIQNGFTVSGTVHVTVPTGTTGCSLQWRAESPLVVVDGTSAMTFLNFQVHIDLPDPLLSSDLFWLVSTSHLVGDTSPIFDSFAASLGFPTITGSGTVADQAQSKLFFDVGSPIRLEQSFELDFSTPALPADTTMDFNFSVTSQSIAPEPATGVLLFAGFAALAVRARRRR